MFIFKLRFQPGKSILRFPNLQLYKLLILGLLWLAVLLGFYCFSVLSPIKASLKEPLVAW